MRARDLERCNSLPLFANTRSNTLGDLASQAQLQRFPADTLLLSEGAPVGSLHVLLEGQVELHGTWNDNETVLAILHPVSAFILAAVVLDTHALMSARTLQRSEILMIPGDAVRRAMRADLDFGAAVSHDLAGDFRTMVRTVKNLKLRSGVQRLANYLVMLHQTQAIGPNRVMLSHEKRVLASLLGMTAENLSRAFAALRGYGVAVNGPLVALNDVPALEALAKPDPLIDNAASAAPAPAIRTRDSRSRARRRAPA